MGIGSILVIVILVLLALGFAAYVIYYHLRARRLGIPHPDFLPHTLTEPFRLGRKRGGAGGGGSRFFGGGGGAAAGAGGSGARLGGGRFSAVEVDEAWDSRVGDELGYEDMRLTTAAGAFDDGDNDDEDPNAIDIDGRYDRLMKRTDDEFAENPFGDGARRVDKASGSPASASPV